MSPRHRHTRLRPIHYRCQFISSPAALCCLLVAASVVRGEHLGSPDLEPGLIGRDDIIFFEDFEYADFYTHWGQSGIPSTCGRVTDPVFDGQYPS